MVNSIYFFNRKSLFAICSKRLFLTCAIYINYERFFLHLLFCCFFVFFKKSAHFCALFGINGKGSIYKTARGKRIPNVKYSRLSRCQRPCRLVKDDLCPTLTEHGKLARNLCRAVSVLNGQTHAFTDRRGGDPRKNHTANGKFIGESCVEG